MAIYAYAYISPAPDGSATTDTAYDDRYTLTPNTLSSASNRSTLHAPVTTSSVRVLLAHQEKSSGFHGTSLSLTPTFVAALGLTCALLLSLFGAGRLAVDISAQPLT